MKVIGDPSIIHGVPCLLIGCQSHIWVKTLFPLQFTEWNEALWDERCTHADCGKNKGCVYTEETCGDIRSIWAEGLTYGGFMSTI